MSSQGPASSKFKSHPPHSHFSFKSTSQVCIKAHKIKGLTEMAGKCRLPFSILREN